jgi:hypothetical protein
MNYQVRTKSVGITDLVRTCTIYANKESKRILQLIQGCKLRMPADEKVFGLPLHSSKFGKPGAAFTLFQNGKNAL